MSNVLLPGKGLKQGPYVSEEELLALTDAAADDDVIEQEERQLIRSVFEFGDTVAREVMVPRPDIVAVEGGQRVTDVIDVAMQAGFSRIPVYDENIDNIIGVVFTKDLLRAEREGKADVDVRNLAREGLFVPESKPVAELMREMQRKKLHLAFVLDEFGDTAGLVTLEDLIEELVGEITDEYDVEEAPIERLPNGDVRVNGKMPIDEVNDKLKIELPEGDDWDTVAGLVFNRLGHVPDRRRDGDGRQAHTYRRAGAGPSHRASANPRRRKTRGRCRRQRRLVRSGFATLLGRPNVGKSTLLNQILGEKVSIVSNKVQTTRHAVRGVLTRPDAQIVFVDTPGIHKPRTRLGTRLNATAQDALDGVDVVCLLLDATQPMGRGDEFVAGLCPPDALVVVNKIDRASKDQVIAQLVAASSLERAEYFPVSARTGEGVDMLVDAIAARLPEGPLLYPADQISDTTDEHWVSELVREQLLAVLREELPHSVACRVVDWEWPIVKVEILVERESQKGIVIGHKGEVLKQVGIAVREQMPEGVFLDLVVKVEKDWQRRDASLDRLGY